MLNSIYDKTDKGREEIATRKYHLPSRLRSLLVMVDGKQTAADLLKKVATLGLDENSIQDLIDQELIGVTVSAELSPAPLADAPAADAAASVAPTNDTVSAANTSPGISASDAEKFQAIYHFFNETIKSTLGLRGFALQMKVERATTLDDFKNLRQAYVEAVLKHKGREMARSLRDRLDFLLYEGKQQTDTLLNNSDLNLNE